MSVYRALCVLAASAAFLSSPAAAAQSSAIGSQGGQEPPPELVRRDERVTVTATRLPEGGDRVGNSVTIIGAEQIALSGAQWLADVLARAPGVTVVRGGGPGTVTSVFLRGANSNQTLVLINGVKVNSPSTGAYDLAGFPASMVERVEILRGPQSTLYGSDAIGGVINIITHTADGPPRFSLAADGGSYSTSRLRAAADGETNDLRWAIGGDFFDTRGFSAADAGNGNTEPDGFRSRAGEARLGWNGPGTFDVEAFITARDGRLDLDGYEFGTGAVDDLDQTQQVRDTSAGVRLRLGAGLWDGELTLSLADQRLELDDLDGFFPRFELDGDLREADFQNTLRLHGDGTLVLGVEARSESTTSLSASLFGDSGFSESVNVTGTYGEYRLVTGSVHATAGLRWDHHSRFGDAATYRIAAAWDAGTLLQLHGSLGTGFRAPATNELYYPEYGNLDLQPEESTGWDAGLRARSSNGSVLVDVTWFSNHVDQLIEFDFPAGFVNVGRARMQGVETALSWIPTAPLRLSAAYTFTDAVDRDTGAALLRRPRQQGSLHGELRLGPGTRLWSEVRVVGPRADSGPLGTVTLPTYGVWNANLQQDIAAGFSVTARFENVTNTHYQEVFGYGTPRRSVYVGGTYGWRSSSPR